MNSALCTLRFGISTVALLTAIAAPAYAQEAVAPQATDTAEQAEAPQTPVAQDANIQQRPAAPVAKREAPQSGTVVVTGTLFRDSNASSISPVTVLTSATLQRANITTAQDAIRSVSADSAGSISTGFRNGFSAGGAAVSLRGLGVSSTVVLIDGLRSANFPLNDDGHNAYVDLNSIPFSTIDRIEVLKDGASSTYGADAIGGVVNLISKKNVQGIQGSVQGGTTEKADGSHYRATLTAGFGDYREQGFNFYVNGEYTYDGYITNHSRGYPFNTLDLTPSGLLDRNRNDDSLVQPNPQAVVTRVRQTDLNNPLAGQVGAPLTNQYQLLINPSACPFGSFTVSSGSAQGTGCKHNLPDEYSIIQPRQERYSTTARLNVRLAEGWEAFASASYSHSEVDIRGTPSGIRQTQPFGGSAALASSSPGIVLPMYVCSAGVNCATAADRRLNPNNPYAVAGADPTQSAARIYYLFGDIPANSHRYVDVFRATGGISGDLGGGFKFRLNGVYARDNFSVTQRGFINIQGLLNAINTGSYNFVNPEQNTAAVRNQISPDRTTPSYSTVATIGGSLLKSLMELPGGELNVGAGFQIRRETLMNRNQNADLSYYSLNTSSAQGRQTVTAGFFEIDAPFLRTFDLNVSGRYDHYSQGYSHFSPKVGAKFTPVEQFSLRATYSQGFRAPTFAENNPASSYSGFSSFTPPASFIAAHPGNSAYTSTYSIGSGSTGNANILPEVSRSFTVGTIFKPVNWFNLTVDYYNIKKSNLIVSGPLRAQAIAAYYGQTNATAGCAALAAVGPGYQCNVIDAPDPNNPNALPRLLVFNVPYVNANYQVSSGIDVQANAAFELANGARLISRLDVTRVLRLDLVTPAGVVQKYAGTLGPYQLSSGGGTPRIRGNWQNSLEVNNFSITATTYYVGRIKQVAADQITPVNGVIDLSCKNTMAPIVQGSDVNNQCYIRPFIYTDLNLGVRVNDQFRFFFNIQNLTNARAPLAAAAYTSNPNYLSSWHYAGLVGRNFSAGANFNF
ncbi:MULTISPECIES: TonB-dependent receptor domain-containing protein [unclassified Sphingomonas]|uniref:TonB-dependent receptor domain-containing protein n=1 Tax=unclassified Sphingomonas TaxID=196159 RepID=UPI002861ABED|nr:iron complex outermembrane receptor protein [Sphingomonas sp. SORGH_AS_0789]MDR6150254.1 iron complex outermembrane receptor protein [Sphingomonas sp. SORGH_AS_0742]